jgi:VanZ family protein
MRRAMLWILPAAVMLVIFSLSSQSRPLPILTEHVWDKLLHFIEYAALGAAWYRALRGEGMSGASALVVAAAATAAFGVSDEWHQSFVPLRDASIRDWMTDLMGGATGAAGYGIITTLNAETAETAERPNRP